jgi:radical SAM superfamily enzyme YgiQ (UPF0313 family)
VSTEAQWLVALGLLPGGWGVSAKRKIWIAQQAVWDARLESLPLAAGYLKAFACADPGIAAECDVRIFSLSGGDTTLKIVEKLFFPEIPDIVCFSVLGWNYGNFKKAAETFKQYNPNGWVIFGGNHVARQGHRVFAESPHVDVVVNGEGEATFRDLLAAFLVGTSRHELHGIEGVSFRTADGVVLTTSERARISRLDTIPSPVLSGAIPLLNERGEFRYDVAIMETNRGCPHKCAFCYWGGAIGQKVRSFSRERLRAELELYGQLGVNDLILCDANFGLLRQDRDFVEDLIEVRDKYGFPRHLESSWAKNKSRTFFEIVERMKDAGLHSNFTLALQTLTPRALKLMRRDNMRVNEWEDIAHWLRKQGMQCYAELIWGCPGETYETFVEGYDKLAKSVYRIATYPHLLMPNTEFFENRDEFSFRTIRGDNDDFEYVLSHTSMSVEDNRRMLRFLFWARILAEYMLFRSLWSAMRALEGITQSKILLSLDRWLDEQDDPVARGLKRCRADVVDNFDLSRVSTGIRYVAAEPGVNELLRRWWTQAFALGLSDQHRDLLSDVFAYDLVTRPISALGQRKPGNGIPADREEVNGVAYFVRRDQSFRYDVPALVHAIHSEERLDLTPSTRTTDLYYKVGFDDFVDNHEFYPQFVGKTLAQLADEANVAPAAISRAVTLDPTRRDKRAIIEESLRRYSDDREDAGPNATATEASLAVAL